MRSSRNREYEKEHHLGVLMVSLTGRRTSARSSLPASFVSALVFPCTRVPRIARSVLTVTVGPAPLIARATSMPLRWNSKLRSCTACLQAVVQCEPMSPSFTPTDAMIDLQASEGANARDSGPQQSP